MRVLEKQIDEQKKPKDFPVVFFQFVIVWESVHAQQGPRVEASVESVCKIVMSSSMRPYYHISNKLSVSVQYKPCPNLLYLVRSSIDPIMW